MGSSHLVCLYQPVPSWSTDWPGRHSVTFHHVLCGLLSPLTCVFLVTQFWIVWAFTYSQPQTPVFYPSLWTAVTGQTEGREGQLVHTHLEWMDIFLPLSFPGNSSFQVVGLASPPLRECSFWQHVGSFSHGALSSFLQPLPSHVQHWLLLESGHLSLDEIPGSSPFTL